jgi:hypothetical protein
MIQLISVSWIARITSVSHWLLAPFFFLFFGGGTRVWTQGFAVDRQVIHLPPALIIFSNRVLHFFFFFFFFLLCLPHSWYDRSVQHSAYWLRCGLGNFLLIDWPGMASNQDLPNLCLLSPRDYSREPLCPVMILVPNVLFSVCIFNNNGKTGQSKFSK